MLDAHRSVMEELSPHEGWPMSAHVPGACIYGHALWPILERWGPAFLTRGRSMVRYLAPVMEGEVLEFDVSGDALVEVRGWASAGARSSDRPAVVLEASLIDDHRARAVARVAGRERIEVDLEGEYHDAYGRESGPGACGVDLGERVHPAVWSALANRLVSVRLAGVGWIQVRTDTWHFASGRVGETVACVGGRVAFRKVRVGIEQTFLIDVVRRDGSTLARLLHRVVVLDPSIE